MGLTLEVPLIRTWGLASQRGGRGRTKGTLNLATDGHRSEGSGDEMKGGAKHWRGNRWNRRRSSLLVVCLGPSQVCLWCL